MAAALSDPEGVLHWTTVGAAAKTLSFETAFPDTAITNKEKVLFSTECTKAAHTVMDDKEDMAETVIERQSISTDYKLKPQSTFVFNQLSDAGRKIVQTLADLSVLPKTEIDELLENCLTKWTTTLFSQTFLAV